MFWLHFLTNWKMLDFVNVETYSLKCRLINLIEGGKIRKIFLKILPDYKRNFQLKPLVNSVFAKIQLVRCRTTHVCIS